MPSIGAAAPDRSAGTRRNILPLEDNSPEPAARDMTLLRMCLSARCDARSAASEPTATSPGHALGDRADVRAPKVRATKHAAL
jgi:hypothetical protein